MKEKRENLKIKHERWIVKLKVCFKHLELNLVVQVQLNVFVIQQSELRCLVFVRFCLNTKKIKICCYSV